MRGRGEKVWRPRDFLPLRSSVTTTTVCRDRETHGRKEERSKEEGASLNSHAVESGGTVETLETVVRVDNSAGNIAADDLSSPPPCLSGAGRYTLSPSSSWNGVYESMVWGEGFCLSFYFYILVGRM